MNERIKELALQAGFPPHWTTDDGYLIEKWEKFAALVEAAARADEREALKKIDWTALMREGSLVTRDDAQELGGRVIAAITARGQA